MGCQTLYLVRNGKKIKIEVNKEYDIGNSTAFVIAKKQYPNRENYKDATLRFNIQTSNFFHTKNVQLICFKNHKFQKIQY